MMRRGWTAVLPVLLGLAAACDSLTDVDGGAAAVSMRAATPASFNASIGGQVPQWMAVQVLDQFSRPLQGVDVSWAVTAGDGTVSVVNAETDAEGISRAYWTIGLRLDLTHRLRATVQGLAPVEFTAQPQFPDPTATGLYVTVTGNHQTGTVGQPLAQPLRVRLVTPDGRPAIGAPVQFIVPAGNGSVVPIAVGTDAQGYATVNWTLGPSVGPQQVSFQVLNASGTFNATATAGAPTRVEVVDAGSEWIVPGFQEQIGLLVLDAFGNPVPGVQVDWAVLAGGGSVDSAVTHTGADGRTYNLWRAGTTVGVQNVLNAEVGEFAVVQFITTTKPFFFRIISPPSPGPDAIVLGNTLRVEASTHPYHPSSEGFRVTSFTLEVAGRTDDFAVIPAPFRWVAEVSLAGLEPGEYTYTVNAEDECGNTHSESVTFTYAP